MSTQQTTLAVSNRFHGNFPHNYDDEDLSFLVTIVSCVLTPVALVLFLLRAASSIRHHRKLFAADYSILTVVLLLCGIWAESLVAVRYGLGKTFQVLPDDNIIRILQIVFAWRINHHAAKIAAQLGIQYMLKEAWTLNNKVYRYFWWAITALTVVTGLSAIIIDAVQCMPASAFWDLSTAAPQHCLDHDLTSLITTIPFGVSSALILAPPMLQIFFAEISRWRKTAMWCLWIVGFFLTWCIGANISLIGGSYDPRNYGLPRFVSSFLVSEGEVFAAILIGALPGVIKLFSRKQTEVEEQGQEPNDGIEDENKA